ncbi:MAG: ATP-binding protein [Fibrobacteres bacterium]|nr:ATP-binding protein [Fibrobacterota bacterium]
MLKPADNQSITIDFPGDLEYVPDVRRLISNLISLRGFSRRFTFRMEIVIDELCSNAVKFGKLKIGEYVTVKADIEEADVRLHVSHPTFDADSVVKLKAAISDAGDDSSAASPDGRGIQIVKILCDKLVVDVSKGTTVVAHKHWTPNDEL